MSDHPFHISGRGDQWYVRSNHILAFDHPLDRAGPFPTAEDAERFLRTYYEEKDGG